MQHAQLQREAQLVAGAPSRLDVLHRRLDELTSALQPGDRLIVSELSRLGRSLGQVVAGLDALAKAGVSFVALKENIRIEGKRDVVENVTGGGGARGPASQLFRVHHGPVSFERRVVMS